MELHAAAGIPNSQVLQDATLMPAQIMKKDADLGSIAPNKLADLVLLDADPVADISNIRKVNLTMKDGVIYRPDELNAELGIAPRTR
jgi:imidazolonepropionase-like amidohydrolase